jgi:hypothetical protein
MMKDPAVLIPPIATVASQMVFTDGAYFVITLNVTDAQGATFNTAVCTDSNGNNPVTWPLKTGTSPFQITYNNLTLLRLILVASAPGSEHAGGTGLLTITLQNPKVVVGPVTVIPDPTNPCA